MKRIISNIKSIEVSNYSDGSHNVLRKHTFKLSLTNQYLMEEEEQKEEEKKMKSDRQ